MDFGFSEEQRMVRDLARGILEKELTVERIKSVENGGDFHDARLWSTLAEAGLVGLAVPARFGGMGLGLLELCVFFEELGRAAAPLAATPTLALGALAVGELGSDEQRERLLPDIVGGKVLLAAAPGASARARRNGESWRVDGSAALVSAAGLARYVLVPVTTDRGQGVVLVDPRRDDVLLRARRSSRGEPLFDVELDGTAVASSDVLGDRIDDWQPAAWVGSRAAVATCALQIGVCERALEVTAGYLRERHQFGVPIGSFQAVQHRLADGYIDLASLRWVTWRAAWKLGEGRDATREITVAKFWAAEAGARIAASAQHLHGGIGVDVDYPIHRYFLWSKALELELGGAHEQLATLGRDMAAWPPRASSKRREVA